MAYSQSDLRWWRAKYTMLNPPLPSSDSIT